MTGINSRHLKYQCVAPYFWIEPTTLLSKSYNSISENNGLSTIVSMGEEVEVDAVPKAQIAMSRTDTSIIGYEHRTARTVPMLAFLQQHELNGLANIVPWNFVSENMCFKGGNMTAEASRHNNQDVSHYMWGRGQSAIPAPSEMMYIGEKFGVAIKHHTLCDDMTIKANHIYNLHELSTAKIKITCTRPTRVSDDKVSKFPKEVQRIRNSAIKALESAREYLRSLGMTGGEMFVKSNSELVFIQKDTQYVSTSKHEKAEVMIDESQRVIRTGPTARKVYQDAALKVPVVKNPVQNPNQKITIQKQEDKPEEALPLEGEGGQPPDVPNE